MRSRGFNAAAGAAAAALMLVVMAANASEAAPPRPKPGAACKSSKPSPPGFTCTKGRWKKTGATSRPSAPSTPATPSTTPASTLATAQWTSGPSNALFTSGTLTIGTGVSLTGPQVGSVFACQLLRGDPAAGGNRQPWIQGTTWKPGEKLKVQGDVAWPGTVSISLEGDRRIIRGNGLPVTSHTGNFPIAMRDPARRYDGNPNAIAPNTVSVSLPAQPQIAATPSCMRGGAIGYTTNGVAIFNALDAANRDAAVYEVLDQCWGHPERSGAYHFHTLSSCVDAGSPSANSPVWGFMLDGFPITGPWENGVRLTTADLDACHGKTSEIVLDGRKVSTYHYVATEDFPYTASCYRGSK